MRTAYKVVAGIAVAIAALAAAAVGAFLYVMSAPGGIDGEADRLSGVTMEEMQGVIDSLLSRPESEAFVEKHPEYTADLVETGSGHELRVATAGGENVLLVEHDAGSGEYRSVYTCLDPDGIPDSYGGEDLASRIPSMCG